MYSISSIKLQLVAPKNYLGVLSALTLIVGNFHCIKQNQPQISTYISPLIRMRMAYFSSSFRRYSTWNEVKNSYFH